MGANTGSRGGEGERERVPDGSNSSSDEDASDYHGSEESDGASEAQSAEISDCGDGSHFNVLVVAISLSLSIFQ